VRPVGPDDGLGAVGAAKFVQLTAGRAVALYEDARGGAHIVAIAAASGGTLWDVPARDTLEMTLSPTRLYVGRSGQLDVRDAATGRLLGTLGNTDAAAGRAR
jgi:hypothetical protein